MKWIDAAYVVLRDAGEPLDARELSDRILGRGLLETSGRTPWETVRARIQTDISEKGEASSFLQVGYSFTLREQQADEQTSQSREAMPLPGSETTAGTRAAATRAAGQMSFADAAEQVLRQSGSHEPMHYEEITDHAIAQGLIQPEGKTPAFSLTAIVGREIRQREARGEQQRFVRHGRGLLGLTEWLPLGLATEIAEHNREVRTKLLERAKQGSPADFEELVRTLLLKMGFDAEVTSVSGDGGIDVRGTLIVANVVRIRMAVQAKRWKANVPAPVVQQVRGSLDTHEQGLIITTSDFSSGARKEAERVGASHPIALMNGEQLADLLAEHEIGMERQSHTLFRLLESEAEQNPL